MFPVKRNLNRSGKGSDGRETEDSSQYICTEPEAPGVFICHIKPDSMVSETDELLSLGYAKINLL